MRLTQPTNRPNFHMLVADEYTVYFSYETPIAFKLNDEMTLYISDNEWGRTTGKHINYLKQNNPYFMQVPYVDLLPSIQSHT